MALTDYSTTPANNNASPPDGAPEGMAAASVNNTMRQMMADIKGGITILVDTIAEMSALDIVKIEENNAVYVLGSVAVGDYGVAVYRVTKADISTDVTNDTSDIISVPFDSDATGASGGFVKLSSAVYSDLGILNPILTGNLRHSVILAGRNHTIDAGIAAIGFADGVTIAGGNTNAIGITSVNVDCRGTTIGGGWENTINGFQCTIAGGQGNEIDADTVNYSVISGGNKNLINGTEAFLSFIGGGRDNVISGAAANRGVICGGGENIISGSAAGNCTIGGGKNNEITGSGTGNSTICGGITNVITGTTCDHVTIGGGQNNAVSGTFGQYGTISGGKDHVMIGSYANIGGGLGLNASSFMEVTKGQFNDSTMPSGVGDPSVNVYVQDNIAESLGIGLNSGARANAYVWLKDGKQIRYNTPVHANNTAALAASELVGTVYRTSTGELMEVF